jgi:ssDNA-binding Zn-finger/Zn-ribbon topoisomerase 1
MPRTQEIGDAGEREVVVKVACPNCKRKLMLLPRGYPLVDVMCTGCQFRAQIKTQRSKPKDVIFGAGWEIMDKTNKAGYAIPPLIVNFVWLNHQEIRFYPFIPKNNLRKRTLSSTARRANYRMFNYVGLTRLPHFVLYKK